jgi:hypothetical protein
VLDLNRELGRSVQHAIYAASEYFGDSWARPAAKAWVAHRDRLGRTVCEPATVRGRL